MSPINTPLYPESVNFFRDPNKAINNGVDNNPSSNRVPPNDVVIRSSILGSITMVLLQNGSFSNLSRYSEKSLNPCGIKKLSKKPLIVRNACVNLWFTE